MTIKLRSLKLGFIAIFTISLTIIFLSNFSESGFEKHKQKNICFKFKQLWGNLTYLTPSSFPFPAIPIVMETESGSCDLFNPKPPPNICTKFSSKKTDEPISYYRDAISSALHHCSKTKECLSIDIGANIGYYTLSMEALGSRVISFEPQEDLYNALKKSIKINCLDDRIRLFHGFATGDEKKVGMSMKFDPKQGFRMSDGAPFGKRFASSNELPFLYIGSFVRGKNIDLVKISADSIDGDLIGMFLDMIEKNVITVKSLIFEFKKVTVGILKKFHYLGYDIYNLDFKRLQRFIKYEPFYEELFYDTQRRPAKNNLFLVKP